MFLLVDKILDICFLLLRYGSTELAVVVQVPDAAVALTFKGSCYRPLA